MKRKHIAHGSMLMATAIIVNFMNFLFNAYLGRMLSFDEFSLVSVFNSFSYLVTVFFTAMYATVNHRSAQLSSQYSPGAGLDFLHAIQKKTLMIGVMFSVAWLAITPFVSSFFHINPTVALFFTPLILIGFLTYANEGFLQGSLRFMPLALVLAIEVVSKLLFAILFVTFHMGAWAYVAIPISAVIAFLLTIVFVPRPIDEKKDYAFPKRFFMASVVTSLATMAYLTFDLMLAKHFLSSTETGQYGLLALVGKMIYFLGVLPNMFLLTLVSRDIGLNKNPSRNFYILLTATASILLTFFIAITYFGHWLMPLLFGQKANAILPYLNLYAGAISLLALSGTITSFHLAKQQFLFPLAAIAAAGVMCAGFVFFHRDIYQFTHVILFTGILNFAVVGSLHVAEARGVLKIKEGW